eukprot:3068384-Alexandrium_andersonii.AAC.1
MGGDAQINGLNHADAAHLEEAPIGLGASATRSKHPARATCVGGRLKGRPRSYPLNPWLLARESASS